MAGSRGAETYKKIVFFRLKDSLEKNGGEVRHHGVEGFAIQLTAAESKLTRSPHSTSEKGD